MWEIVYALGLPTLIGTTGFWFALRANRQRVDRWDETVTLLGFKVIERSRSYGWFVKLEARQGAMTVKIEDSRRRRHDVPTRVILSIPGPPGSAGLRVRREVTYKPGAREIEIGDKAFDETFSIEGPIRVAAVLLDGKVRSLLTRLNESCRRVGIIGNDIVVELYDGQIPDTLPLLMDIGERFSQARFSQAMDISQRLAENACQDPQVDVRILNLRLLARDFPGEPVTGEALRHACSDPSPRVRLQAALKLGGDGRDVLLELAEGLADDECSAQAVAALGEMLPFERGRDLLTTALRRRLLRTAQACLTSLVQSGHPVAVETLTKVLAREQGELAVAAAKALGKVGSAASVLPLKEIAENLSLDSELRRAARQSVAEIQSRVPGAHGQLSLAGDEAGRLSMAEVEAGQLSLAPDAAGQLSLDSSGRTGKIQRNRG